MKTIYSQLDFKGQPQRITKSVRDQNSFELVSIMTLRCRVKNEVKISSDSGDILCQKIEQSDLHREVWCQNSRTRLFHYLE